MTVVNPKSISGINSITMASGSDDLLTIHSNNTTERVRVNNSGDVIVGSGVTLSPDGDIFATGITTVSGNVKVGTGITLSPDGDVFFTGIITGNGSGLTNLATDLVNDTSPQLGGDLDTNDFEILLDDNHAVKFGAGVDLDLRSNGTNGIVHSPTGHLRLQTTGSDKNVILENASTGEYYGIFKANGAAELYHDGTKQCETSASGLAFPSGKGIDFSATSDGSGTSSSELLDDYEEGTWTITVSPGGGSYGVSHMVARYVKIGSLVTVQGWWRADDISGVSGSLTVSGFPYATLDYSSGGGVRQHLNLNVAHVNYSGLTFAKLRLGNNSAQGSIMGNTAGASGGLNTWTAGNIAVASELYINGSYIAAQ